MNRNRQENDWENPEMVGRNKEPGHVPLVPFPDEAAGLAADLETCPYVLGLNGDWRFCWAPHPAAAPADFFLEGFDVYASYPGRAIEGNDDWELVVTRGFTDRLNSYAWNAIVYPADDDGGEIAGSRLYIGTFNLFRGFTLYSITADEEWAVEVGPGSTVRNGIWTPLNYGVRTLEIWEGKLIIGCAGMFKPTDVWMAW